MAPNMELAPGLTTVPQRPDGASCLGRYSANPGFASRKNSAALRWLQPCALIDGPMAAGPARFYRSSDCDRLGDECSKDDSVVPSVGELHDICAVVGVVLNRAARDNHPNQRIAVLEVVRVLSRRMNQVATGTMRDVPAGIVGEDQNPRARFLG